MREAHNIDSHVQILLYYFAFSFILIICKDFLFTFFLCIFYRLKSRNGR